MSKVKSIDALQEEFTALQEYSDQQFKTIIALKEKLDTLEAQNNAMRVALEKKPVKDLNIPNLDVSGLSNEQLICTVQIALLKETALSRQLSFEETRQFATLTDTLIKLEQNGKKQDGVKATLLSDDDLLRIVDNRDGNKNVNNPN